MLGYYAVFVTDSDNFYSVIKDNDAQIKFAFITGVSKFSKVSIFSGLNNLEDITLNACYSAICGYTEDDLDEVFGPELEGLDRQQIKDWYNGYNWTGEAVYNPYDLLLLFDSRLFRCYWFETGTPTFLVDVLTGRGVFSPNLESLSGDEDLLGSFDIDHISTEALLWQTGYLTIQGQRHTGARIDYQLGYPNLEVRSALNNSLAKALMGDPSQASRRAGAGGQGAGATQGQELCRKISEPQSADSPYRHRIQQGAAQSERV